MCAQVPHSPHVNLNASGGGIIMELHEGQAMGGAPACG